MGEDGAQIQQCINCGYSTTSNYFGDKKTNKEYQNLNDEMKSWSKEANGNIWIPTMMTLPFAMLYPTNVKGEMKWALAKMVDIPEEEKENYPREDGKGYYEKRFDTDSAKIYDKFILAMSELNDIAKKESANGKNSI